MNLLIHIFLILLSFSSATDNDLPKYIVKLITNQQYTIEVIKQDLSLFCDNNFLDWLEIYVSDKRPDSSKKHVETIAASELEEDVLDFEENVDENEELNEADDLNSSNNSSNKRKLEEIEQTDEQSSKRLQNNDKEPVKLTNKKDQTVISLTNNQHLNDIGLMRRKAMEERSKLTPDQASATSNNQESGEEFFDLREKLNRNKERKEEEQMESRKEEESEDKKEGDEDAKTRCRFWPLCKKESECIYHHPTEQCKKFPNCTEGEKCLFIHPLCKFDAKCTKHDCPFLHITKKQQLLPAALSQQMMTIECKFYPNCLNIKCPFLHPKLCIYGAMCKNQACTFKHPDYLQNVAKPHQLKWTSKTLGNNNR